VFGQTCWLDGEVPSPRLTPEQASLVGAWFPGAEPVTDLSWDLVDTTVLHLRVPGVGDVVVKAAGHENAHLPREMDAYRSGVLAPLRDRVPRLLHADRARRVLAVGFLPGVLVASDPALADDVEVHRQAGELLGHLHRQPPVVDGGWERRQDAKALAWLDRPHRLDPSLVDRLRELLRDNRYRPSTLVPTHGDWQPRNWLWGDGRLLVIDLGRFEPRPAQTDLARLAHQHWREHPELEAAFVDGYGGDPRDPVTWRMVRLREAVGTACYAFAVGDATFEAQGHAMIDEALAAF
jgi:hypothetical protein